MEEIKFYQSGFLRKGEKHNCEYCGKEFVRRIKMKKKKSRYCSNACAKIASRKRVIVQCANCSKSFERSISKTLITKSGLQFCSRRCKDFAQSLDGGCTDIQPKHYGLGNGAYNYRDRCGDKIKDGCRCGEKREFVLLVHHIDGNRKNNLDDNLEVVCGTCHIIRHLQYTEEGWRYYSAVLTPKDRLEEFYGASDVRGPEISCTDFGSDRSRVAPL